VACLDVKAPGQALGFFCCGNGSITLGSSCLGFCLQLSSLLGSIAGRFVPPVADADFYQAGRHAVCWACSITSNSSSSIACRLLLPTQQAPTANTWLRFQQYNSASSAARLVSSCAAAVLVVDGIGICCIACCFLSALANSQLSKAASLQESSHCGVSEFGCSNKFGGVQQKSLQQLFCTITSNCFAHCVDGHEHCVKCDTS